jgi:toxin CptA
MHNAPSVSYPVGRSHFQAGLLVLTVLTGLIVDIFWSTQSLWGWRQGLVGLSLCLAVVFALHEWLRTPQGTLNWDGVGWCFSEGQGAVIGGVTVSLDLQFVLLLRLTPNKGPSFWLWAERRRQALLWVALRRAVFSRPTDLLHQPQNEESPVKSEKS